MGEGEFWITTVLSSSKISFNWALARRLRGGVGVRFAFDFIDRGRPFRENMPCVHDLTAFLFFMLALRSGDVLGRASSSTGLGAKVWLAKGSAFSALGVGLGEPSAELLDQKCFFLVGGLPLLVTAGEPEADSGRFGKVTTPDSCIGSERPRPNVAGSAVTGLLRGLTSEPIGLLNDCSPAQERRGFGLVAMELILPEREWFPRIVEVLPSVSDDINDNGRGITSTVSEKPTLGRTPGALPRRRGDAVGDLVGA